MKSKNIYNKFFISAFILFIVVLCMVTIQAKSPSTDKPSKNNNEKVQVLTLSDMPKLIYDYKKNPDKWVYEGKKPAIIDFYADWCGPCKKISPIVSKLAKKYQGKIVVYKVNVDTEKELAAMFGIRSIPTLVYLPMQGKPFQSVGVMPDTENHLEKLITDSLLVTK